MYKFTSIASFGIFSRKFVRSVSGRLFDETYINSSDDIDLDIRLSAKTIKTGTIDYRIGDLIGSTLGTDNNRRLRDIAGYSYLNYKIEKGMLPIHLEEC